MTIYSSAIVRLSVVHMLNQIEEKRKTATKTHLVILLASILISACGGSETTKPVSDQIPPTPTPTPTPSEDIPDNNLQKKSGR